jgi:hypothetical protein
VAPCVLVVESGTCAPLESTFDDPAVPEPFGASVESLGFSPSVPTLESLSTDEEVSPTEVVVDDSDDTHPAATTSDNAGNNTRVLNVDFCIRDISFTTLTTSKDY